LIGSSYYGNISQSLLETTPENVGSFHVLETIGGEKCSSSMMSTLPPRVFASDWYKVRSGEPMQENADIAEAMDDSNKSMMRESSPPPRVR
jgi:pimeloyl-ACP methyl ester carboxylesterase